MTSYHVVVLSNGRKVVRFYIETPQEFLTLNCYLMPPV